MNNEIIIIYQEVGKIPQLRKIKNSVCEFKNILEGEFEIIPYNDIVIVCKKARKDLFPNIYIDTKFLSIGETIRGNIIISCKENDNFKSLTKEQAQKCLKLLKNASFRYDDTDESDTINDYKTIAKRLETSKNIINFKNQNDETLKLILNIQKVILKFINEKSN